MSLYESDGEDFCGLGFFRSSECINPEDAQLVYEPRDALTDDEKEVLDLHLACCLSCQTDWEFDRMAEQFEKDNSR